MSNNNKVTLKTSDKKLITIDDEIAMQSEYLKEILEKRKADNDNGNGNTNDKKNKKPEPIKLEGINARTLKKIIKYCESYRVFNIKNDNYHEPYEWEKRYLKSIKDKERLFDITAASEHLKIKPLSELTCRHIASSIYDKTPQDIEKYFGIKNLKV